VFSVDDRRKRARVALHWPMRLFRQSGEPPIESLIENLSSEGLYCITSEPFKSLDRLQCEIIIPATLGSESPIVLKCRLTIRRVEHLRNYFGLGCHIEDYSVRTTSKVEQDSAV
jgi:hypothetical protein